MNSCDNTRTKISRSALSSEGAAQSSDSEEDRHAGRFNFKSLSRKQNAPASSPSPPIPSVDPSPSPSALVSRGQSHIPDLPSTPSPPSSLYNQNSRASSRILRDGSPERKRRRLDSVAANKTTEPSSSLATPRSADGRTVRTRASDNTGKLSRNPSSSQKSDSESSEGIELELTQSNPVEDGEGMILYLHRVIPALTRRHLEGSSDGGMVGLAEADIGRLEHNLRDVLPSQGQSEDRDPGALSSLVTVQQLSQQQIPPQPVTNDGKWSIRRSTSARSITSTVAAEGGLPILDAHSGSLAPPEIVAEVKTGYVPRSKSGILDMSGEC